MREIQVRVDRLVLALDLRRGLDALVSMESSFVCRSGRGWRCRRSVWVIDGIELGLELDHGRAARSDCPQLVSP